MNERLYFCSGQALLSVLSMRPDEHSHHALQITVALEGDLEFCDKTRNWQRAKGIAVTPDTSHEIISKKPCVFLFLDPESDRVRSLNLQKDSGILTLENSAVIDELSPLFQSERAGLCDDATYVIDTLLSYVPGTKSTGTPRGKKSPDSRIRKALEFIRQGIRDEDTLTLSHLALKVGLSDSRFIHLFTAEIGLPLRRFILWNRLLIAVEALLAGQSFSSAAYDAGFSDQSHLNRTFRDMFGIKPTDFFSNGRGSFEVITPQIPAS